MRVRRNPILADRERLPSTAPPNQNLLYLPHPVQFPALPLSPSRRQHLADQLLQAAPEGPGETGVQVRLWDPNLPFLGNICPHF